MNKNDYLNKLKRALSNVSAAERERTLSYYSELIDDRIEEGVPEAQVISELEPPQAVVSRLLAEGVIHRQSKKTNTGLIVGVSIGVLLLIAVILVPILSFSGVRDKNGDPNGVPVTEGEASTVTREYPSETRFEFDLVSSSLTVEPSKDDSYHLYYRTSDKTKLTLKENQGSVVLKEDNVKKWFFSTGWNSTGTLVTLQVPEKEKSVLSCSTVSGDAEFKSVLLDGVNIVTVSGDVEIKSADSAQVLSIVTTSGNVDLTGCSLSSVSAVTVSGDLVLENTEFDSLDFETVSGNLEGELKGKPEDYGVYFSTVSGSNSLKGLSGPSGKQINVNSVSGDIDLDFES